MRIERLWPLVEWRAAQTPDGEMLVDERGRRVTFRAFRDRAERVAAGLAERGVGVGTAVTWQLPTTIETLVLTAALARLGAVQNPVMPTYNVRDLAFVVRQTNAELLVVAPDWNGRDVAGDARRVAEEIPDLELLVVGDDLPEADSAPPAVDFTENAVRWIFYTSGTTADPKGARHTDASVLASSRGVGEGLRCTPQDRVGMVFPVAHIGGCGTWTGTSLIYGCTLIIDSVFDPVRTTELQRREHVTLAGSGAMFIQIYLQAQRRLQPGERLFPEVRALTSGAAPKPPTLHAEVKREMGGVGVLSGYGMTEAPILAMSRPDDPDDVLASTEGRLCAEVDARIVDLGGRVLGPGEEGELRVKAPQVMQGYVDPALDAGAFDEDGYLRTGDLAVLDPDGNVTITGRTKDVIIRKGENISARAIEEELSAHPAVADVAVVGLPHPEWGEIACAVVVLAEPEATFTLGEAYEFLDERGFAKRQRPERVEVVGELPRSATGKIRKDALRRSFGS